MILDTVTFIIPLVLLIVLLVSMLKILREYERGVVFMLGRFWSVKGPGLIIIIQILQEMMRVDLRTMVLDVTTQDVISRDNVSVKVNAVVYMRVVDPEKAIIQVENYFEATSQLAQTTLRSVWVSMNWMKCCRDVKNSAQISRTFLISRLTAGVSKFPMLR